MQPPSLTTLPASWLRPSLPCELPGQAWGPAGCWLIDYLLVAFWGREGSCLGPTRDQGWLESIKAFKFFKKKWQNV